MTTPQFIVPTQRFFSLALATLLTVGVLASLAAQASESRATALAQAGSAQQLCATQPGAERI
ncbi:MAG: hypothetical protein CFE45_03885 [Burkholderiales bacterium PBB5]|nr:MAG: hypothetical protein CFE45_03885 [Burkholderiales bacterium PBB5]